jgi:YggT family protein
MQMFVVSFINILFDLMSFAIIARILMSWVRTPGAGKIKMFLNDITDPILVPFKRPIFQIGIIDLSPIVVLILLDISKSLLINIAATLLQNL